MPDSRISASSAPPIPASTPSSPGGIEPDLIVGDMDSVSSLELLKRFPLASLHLEPRDKDETDTELGLAALAANGAERIVLAGGGGGAPRSSARDTLPLRAFALGALEAPAPPNGIAPERAVFLVEEGRAIAIDAEAGSTVSVFPLSDGAEGMSSEGLKWPLGGLRWGPGDFGVSNLAPEGSFSVRSGKGELLVVLLLS